MNITAIISEYNPLHNGHKYQIDVTKELTKSQGIVSIMSGNFVQRGEPAIIDKWHRTKMALSNGIDLVLELPAIYALSSAEYFAHGAISLINSLNSINSISFGSEEGNVAPLLAIANILYHEPTEYKEFLKTFLSSGCAFPTARSRALQEYFSLYDKYNTYNYSDIVSKSNNILGIEYCKSIVRNNSPIKPYTIQRIGSGYNDVEIANTFSSATAIRKFIKDNSDFSTIKEQLPSSSFDIIMKLIDDNYEFIFPENMFKYIQYKALTDFDQGLSNLKDSGEGLHNRIYKYIEESNSLEELIRNIKTKRYTYTRISRLLTQYFIGFERFNVNNLIKESCTYVRVLGLNSKGAEILKYMKNNSNIDILTKMPKKSTNAMLHIDINSTRAYSVINKNVRHNEDYLSSPIIY